jgi:phosphohistidine phosphatase SixA
MGALCSRLDSSELYEDGGRFVIRFVCANDVPRADVTSASDPYIKAYLVDGGARSRVYTSGIRWDNPNPIWNAYHDFRVSYRLSAALRVEIWDSDVTSHDDLIGDVNIPLDSLRDEGVFTFPMRHRIGTPTTNPNFTVTLQRLFVDAPPPMRKTVFLLRHGESKWNEAQAKSDLAGLVDLDHALSAVGVEQALAFAANWKAVSKLLVITPKSDSPRSIGNSCDRRSSASTSKRVTFALPEDEISNTQSLTASDYSSQPSTPSAKELLEKQTPPPKLVNYEEMLAICDKIYVSPLTRAVETALLCLQDHPIMKKDGLVLYRYKISLYKG